MSQGPILSRSVDVARIPAEGVDVEIVAGPQERTALAEAFDLLDVKALSATVTLHAVGRSGVALEGRVVADIVQTCVISLAPADQHIDEPFSVRFVTAGSPEAAGAAKAPSVPAGVEAEPPEVLAGPTIDVGALAEEYFVLAIDPYPRAPGASLPDDVEEARDAGADSPFAALAGRADRTPPKG